MKLNVLTKLKFSDKI